MWEAGEVAALRARGPVLESPAQLDIDLSPATPTLGHVDLLTSHCVAKVLAKTVNFRFSDSRPKAKRWGAIQNTQHLTLSSNACGVQTPTWTYHTYKNNTHKD